MATYLNWFSIKEKDGNFGKFLACSIKYDALKEFVNEKGYINFSISPRKSVGNYGETHNAVLYEKRDSETPNQEQIKTDEEISIGELPF